MPSFTLCAPNLWIGHLNDLEINLPGDNLAPHQNAISFLSEIASELPMLQDRAKNILLEFSKLSEEWAVDALQLRKTIESFSEFDVCLELSNDEDLYGLWSVRFTRIEGKWAFREVSRLQQ